MVKSTSILFFLISAMTSFSLIQKFKITDYTSILTCLTSGFLFLLATCAYAFVQDNRIKFSAFKSFVFPTFIIFSILFLATYFSSFTGIIISFFTSGMGAIVLFFFFNDFLIPISYKKRYVFLIGSLCSWLSTTIFAGIVNNFQIDLDSQNIVSFFFFTWQILMGCLLSFKIYKEKAKKLA
jgi:hypothetical protein